MAAIRFHSEYISYTGDQYRIEIWDTEHTGDSTLFTSGDDGFSLSYEGEGSDVESVILATSLDIDFYIENSTHEAIITDIATSQEGRFLVRILWTASDVKFWHGMVLPDIGSYEEASCPYVLRLRATDGMASLKDVDYADDGDEYTGKQSLLMHVVNCLRKLPYIDTFYGDTDNFISSYIDWWEGTHTHTSGSECALFQTFVDHAAFITYEKSTPEFVSCYDVLKNVMTILRARITSANGSFWIEQMGYRTASTVIGRGYTKLGAFLGTGNFSGANIINQTNSGALEAVGNYSFVAPIKRHIHTFQSYLRRNFLAGAPEWTESNFLDKTINKPIQSSNNATTLRITGNINITISSNTAPGTPIPPFVMVFRIRVKVGSKYLRRPYNLTPSYQINYDPTNWSSSSDYAYVLKLIDHGFFLGNTTGASFTFTQAVDFMTAGVPESADNFDFGFALSSLTRYDGTAMNLPDFDIAYSFENANLQAYTYGAPINTEDEREYNCFNTINPKNSLVTKSNALIGTGTDPNTVGALWVDDSGYILADNWGEGTETPGKDIEALLAETTVSARAVPNRVLSGTLYGNIVAMSRLHWRDEKWILLGGTWNAHHDQFTGEWFELNYQAGLTTSPPIKKIIKAIDTQVPTAPISGSTGGPTYELTTRPPATILTPLSLTNTGAALMLPTGTTSQTITTLPISEVLTDGDLYVGDTVAIINPLSGEWDELTVTATTEAGDTSIAVSGTLNANYPIGSTIFKKPKIGAFSLPIGADGQVLFFDVDKWVAKSADGDIEGHYDNLQIKANAVGTTEIADNAVSANKIGTGQVTMVKINQSGATTGQAIVWNGSAWAPATVSGYTDEQAQDAVGGILVDSAEIDFTYNDGTPSITALLIATGVTAGTWTKLTVDAKGRVTSATTLSASDIPNLPASIITSGVLPVVRGGTGLSALGTALQYLRTNAGATAMEWATLTAITGSLTASRIPYASGASALVDTADLQWDNTTKGIRAGAGAGGVVGTFTAYPSNGNGFYAFASVSGAVFGTLENFFNASNSGNAYWIIKVGGASAGDPFIMFVIASATTWSAGVDNSDNDIFKIGPYQNPGNGALGLQILPTGEFGLCGAPSTALSVANALAKPFGLPNGSDATRATGNANPNMQWNANSGRLEVISPGGPYYKPILSYTAPTVTAKASAGTGATIAITGGSNAMSGQISLTTGSTGLGTGNVIEVAVSGNMGGVSFPVLGARNSLAAAQMTNFYIGAASVSGFNIYVTTALAASTTYILTYYTGS